MCSSDWDDSFDTLLDHTQTIFNLWPFSKNYSLMLISDCWECYTNTHSTKQASAQTLALFWDLSITVFVCVSLGLGWYDLKVIWLLISNKLAIGENYVKICWGPEIFLWFHKVDALVLLAC